MRIAQDAIPGQMIPMWFTPITDRNLRNCLRPALWSRPLQYERHARRRYSRGLSGVVEGTRRTFRDAKRAAADCATAGRAAPGPTPGTVPPPGAPKTENPTAADSSNLRCSGGLSTVALFQHTWIILLERERNFIECASERRNNGFIASPGSLRSPRCFSFAAAEWSRAKTPDSPCRIGRRLSATTCFFFPSHKWVGGIFFEHTHRLIASTVGFLTIILPFWLWRSRSRRWVRNLGYDALAAVIMQGVLGGLRVTMLKDEIGIFTPVSRRRISRLLIVIALVTTTFWDRFLVKSIQSDNVRMLVRVLRLSQRS